MIIQNKENPAARETLTGSDTNAFPGGNCNQDATPKANIAQATIERSPAVAAAIRRAAQRRLLAIKQGSLWSLATMAGASHDALMESLEDSDGEEIVERGARFIDHARGFAKLLADFRDARGAGR